MSVRSVLDELMPLLEPEATHRDDSRARPVEFDPIEGPIWSGQPGMLYGWPRRESFNVEGAGQLDLERFSLRLAWAVEAEIEVAAGDRDRRTSEVLFDKADAIATWLRDNRTHDDADGATVWEHIGVSQVDYESLITGTVRGIYVDIDGYTLRS